MDNIFKLEMPGFAPVYDKEKQYGYRGREEKEALRRILAESSGGYCMYCYTRVKVDGKMYADLEHAIEKSNSDKLIDCVPNIGLACNVCNQTLKKSGERKRKLPSDAVLDFEKESACMPEQRKQCATPCKALRKLQLQYSSQPEGAMILQPMGMKGGDTGEELALQYDVLKMEFQAATDFHTYSENEKAFINLHIQHFRLNDPVYRTRQLSEFIKNVINSNGVIPKYEYNNRIVDLFCKKLQNKSPSDVLKICESIYCIIFAKI